MPLIEPPSPNAAPLLVLGTHYHPGAQETLARQQAGQESLRGLSRVDRVNLQFPDAPLTVPGFHSMAGLDLDSLKLTGRTGLRKPVGRQLLELLAGRAGEVGAPSFGFVNADVQALPEVLTAISRYGRDAFLFSRTDVNSVTHQREAVFFVGIDMFIFRLAWWQQHCWRFRKFIVGEGLWDPIYTSITLCHSNGILFNNRDFILHPNHKSDWHASPFSDWNIFLSCLDFLYLQQWNRYSKHLTRHSPEGISDEAMEQTQREFFSWAPPLKSRLWQTGRSVKAFGRYRLNRWGLLPSVHYPV